MHRLHTMNKCSCIGTLIELSLLNFIAFFYIYTLSLVCVCVQVFLHLIFVGWFVMRALYVFTDRKKIGMFHYYSLCEMLVLTLNGDVFVYLIFFVRLLISKWCVCVFFVVVVDRGTLHIRSQFQRFHHMFATKRPRIKTLMFQSLCWFFLSLSHFSVSLQSHRIFVFKFNRIFAWLLLYGQVSMDSIFLILIKNIAIFRWIL